MFSFLCQRGWLCRRHRWIHRWIISQRESNTNTKLMPGELWHIRVCVCVCGGGVWFLENHTHEGVSHDEESWWIHCVFVPDQSSSRCLCAPNTLPCLSHVISIGFNSRWSHVVASQLKNKLRQYGSIWAHWKHDFLCFSCTLSYFPHFNAVTIVFFLGCHCTHP